MFELSTNQGFFMNEIDNTVALAESLSMKAYELGLEYAPKLALAILTLVTSKNR